MDDIFWTYLDIYERFWTYNEDGADNDENQAGDGLVLVAVAHGARNVLGDGVGDGLALENQLF